MNKFIRFLTVTAVFSMLAVLFTGCDRRERLHIFNWAVYTPPPVIEAFEREYGVRVIYTEFASSDEMLTDRKSVV